MEKINKKQFKLVLGLGNNSLEQISKLCEIYSQAGADIFDLSPNVESIKAARAGVAKAGLNPDGFKYCVSFGLKGDQHVQKALIKKEKCIKCFECIKVCPQDAIFIHEEYPKVDESKCIGCKRCAKTCIDFYDVEVDIETVTRNLKPEKIDMVELHISSLNKPEIIKNWKFIIENFNCKKSICIDRSKYGNLELINLVTELIKMNPGKTIIQADGVAMSGSAEKASTLQAIAHAQIYENIDAEIFISGGTNNFTSELAKEMNIRFDGITIGSYAREIVKGAIKNSNMNSALEIAKMLVNSVKT